MTKAEKLMNRFMAKPKDFSFDELTRLLNGCGYVQKQRAGSRVLFHHEKNDHKIKLHKPHPENALKRYQLDLIENELKQKGLL